MPQNTLEISNLEEHGQSQISPFDSVCVPLLGFVLGMLLYKSLLLSSLSVSFKNNSSHKISFWDKKFYT